LVVPYPHDCCRPGDVFEQIREACYACFEVHGPRRLTAPSSPAWSRTPNSNALGMQQVAAPSPVQRRVMRNRATN
jgi:hypothetical protein